MYIEVKEMKNLKLNLCLIPVQRQVQKFAKQIIRNVKFKVGVDFAYYHEDNLIEYALLITDSSGDYFYKFIIDRSWEQYQNIRIEQFDIFLVSLLHEIGHVFTFHYNDYDKYFEQRELYDTMSINAETIEERNKIFNLYHNLPEELAATDFAIKFMQNNYDYCVQWNSIFNKTFQKFFKRMNIE